MGEICACAGDADCAEGFCECADAACQQRMCRSAPCACSTGDACSTPLDDGVFDPNTCAEGAACYGGVCLAPADLPSVPTPGEVVTSLSVTVRTLPDAFAATGDTVRLCMSDTDCFTLDRAEITDLAAGAVDTFHFDGVEIPRSRIDRVEWRIDGIDDWAPACLSLQLDGDPSYCVDGAPVVLGDETDSVTAWRDPEGLHVSCRSCYEQPLTHGPMLGAIEADRARVWVRTDASRQVGLRLSAGPDTSAAPVAAWVRPEAEHDFTAVLEADALSPGTTYYYAIEIDGEIVSEPGLRFTTPPAVGTPGVWRVGVGSCARANHPQDIFAPITAAAPDLFLFLGDNHYGDADTLVTQRWNYYWLHEVARRPMLARVPSVAIWDDHDFLGNNTDGTHPGRAMAREVFRDYWANPGYGQDGEGIYSSLRHGDVDFFLLDGRSFRDPVDGPVAFGDPSGRPSLLGPDQTTWLIEELAASTATFKFLANGSQWNDEGNADSWASYPLARDALFTELEERGVEGVILLSGDRHRSEYHRLPRPSGYDLPELTSSPLANTVRACPSDDPGLLGCHDQGYQVMFMEVDTTAADPTVTAVVHELQGEALVPVAEWIIRRSELSFE